MSRKWIVTVIAGLLLLGIYYLIFSFSAEDALESGSRSREISKKCVEVYDKVAKKGWNEAEKNKAIDNCETPIRKIAHFSEYALTGILLFIIWSQWISNGKKLYFLIILWLIISAGIDEFHQSFVPGRDGNIVDVCIDTAGGMVGMLICLFVLKTVSYRKRIIDTKID